jgi:cyclophilin family peptidyl-prolyl cis-trans isomerase
MRPKILALLFIAVLLISVFLLSVSCGGTTTTSSTTPVIKPASTSTLATTTQSTPEVKIMKWNSPPEMEIDVSKDYYATVDTTLGTFKIQLFANESPKTVNNFVFLSQQGFYDGVIFHRIIKTFMIQTGDPTGTGTGGPGYKFADELPPKHPYGPGIVAMANSGPNTNGSQFFICTGSDSAGLDSHPNYTQFGNIVEGMDIVQKIAAVPVGPGNMGENSRPVQPPVINKISITSQ